MAKIGPQPVLVPVHRSLPESDPASTGSCCTTVCPEHHWDLAPDPVGILFPHPAIAIPESGRPPLRNVRWAVDRRVPAPSSPPPFLLATPRGAKLPIRLQRDMKRLIRRGREQRLDHLRLPH